ncbi:MAG: hypothetical protein L6Q84_02950 [Polyangiaceae bacterium]|nr:hypothetical protein [Polyangiaceae bacterium]
MRNTEDFERAFVATSYLLDRRGEDLTRALGGGAAPARRLAAALGHPERSARAVVLAREVARIAQALDARRLT